MHDTRPHIAISAHLLAARGAAGYRSAGIHTYITQLLRHLPQVDAGFRYTLYANAFPDGSRLPVRSTRWPTARPLARILWEQLAQPIALRRGRPDLLHATAFVAPLITRLPYVITVYDLSFAMFPELFRGPNQTYLRTFTRRSARRARRVIAISEHTRRDVARMYGLPLDRVDVAYPGVDERFQPLPEQEVEGFRRKRGLPDRFFLYLGTLEPRKNLGRLIDAFARLSTDDCQLILAGGKGWLTDELFAKVKSLGLEARVTFAGFVLDEDMPRWYNAATAFVYPSLYEGFGMPPLEAMACGTPVITSNAASLPEVVGQAGLTVEPTDVVSLAGAMLRIWDDAALRHAMSARGLEQARQFTWEATARATVESYRRALQINDDPLTAAPGIFESRLSQSEVE